MIIFGSIVQAHAKELVVNHGSKLANRLLSNFKLIDKLDNWAFEAPALLQRDLDKTTLAKIHVDKSCVTPSITHHPVHHSPFPILYSRLPNFYFHPQVSHSLLRNFHSLSSVSGSLFSIPHFLPMSSNIKVVQEYFKDKVVWVTGASSGLGEALCFSLCSQTQLKGLILSARREDALERVKRKCVELQPDLKAVVLPLDLSRVDSLSTAVVKAQDTLGRIDVLFNNGGIGFRGLAAETSLDIDQYIMNVNFFSGVALVKALQPAWLERRSGHIVQISGVQGFVGLPGRSALAAAKHAVIGFYDSLRAEMAENGVSVTMVCPGYIATNHSLNALQVPAAARYPEGDISKGVAPEVMAPQILAAVSRRKPEFMPAALDAKVATLIRAIWPRVIFWIMERRSRKERKAREDQ